MGYRRDVFTGPGDRYDRNSIPTRAGEGGGSPSQLDFPAGYVPGVY
jgi:hypothetical protein